MKSILIALVAVLIQTVSVLGDTESKKKNESLVLRFDDQSITLSSKDIVNYAICHKLMKAIVELRGVAGLRIEHEVEMPIKGNVFSLKSVSVVGEKVGGYFRFLHAENQQAVVATEDLDEAIRLCLARFNVVSVKKVETD